MKILYIVSTLFRGGAERSTQYLASEVKKAGHSVSLLAMHEGGELESNLDAEGIPFFVKSRFSYVAIRKIPPSWRDLYYRHQIGKNRKQYVQDPRVLPPLPGSPALERWVKSHIVSLKPDIVHVHQSNCVEALKWASESGVRGILYTHHNMSGEVSGAEELQRLNDHAGFAHRITFVSSAQREDFLKIVNFTRERTSVVYPGTSFRGTMQNTERIPTPLMLGTISNLSPVKDPMTLLAALEILLRNGADLRLSIGGGDPRWRAVIEEEVRRRNLSQTVRFWGILDSDAQLQSFYDGIDLYVSTSLSESFGQTVAEAMSSGRAVISSDVLPAGELMENGRTGLIFRRGDANDLAEKIRRFLNNPDLVRSMGMQGRQKFMKEFRGTDSVGTYVRLYQHLVQA